MTNKTRKHIWPGALVMSIAIVGFLAAFVVLANNPGAAMAHEDADHAAACEALTDAQRARHDAVANELGQETCGTGGMPPPQQAQPQVGGAPDSYVIEGPGFVDQQANQVSDYVLVVKDEDGNNPDYATHGKNMVRVRFSRHDAVPSIDEAGDILVGCLPDDARLVDVGLQGALTASLQGGTAATLCSITLDLEAGNDSFSIHATAVPNNTRLGISLTVIADADSTSLVDTHTVTFLNPGTPPPPPEPEPIEVLTTDCYSIVGYPDENRDDLADPTIASVDAEIGQDTVQVLNGIDSVQLTVTSCQEGPVYIRFLDSNGDVFGTDVDECETCPDAAGADVVGLDSQGRLELNLMSNYTSAEALMYDQYTLISINPDTANPMERLEGKAGQYWQGKFRFYAPCEWGPFNVQVHEPSGKVLQELQNGMMSDQVTCVPGLQALANELQVSFDTADVTDNIGIAVVTWEAIDGAVNYTVAVIDTASSTIHGTPAFVTVAAGDPAANRVASFPGIVHGDRYVFAVYAQVDDGSYSSLRAVILTPEFVPN
jgi:hypothetical protein